METAVLIHGCHTGAHAWTDIVWGDPQNGRLGRVPKGILEAQKWDAKTIIFSTGASERDGFKEGEYIYRFALDRVSELTGLTGMHESSLRALLHTRHALELTSQDTRSEVLESAKIAKERGAKRLILVSSPTHVMRCHQAAISMLGADPRLRFFLDNLYPAASETCFEGSTVDDVVIVEPPHRGDRPLVPYHTTAKRIFQFLKKPEVAFAFNDAWGGLIGEYEKKM
jgi:hypothetical protein